MSTKESITDMHFELFADSMKLKPRETRITNVATQGLGGSASADSPESYVVDKVDLERPKDVLMADTVDSPKRDPNMVKDPSPVQMQTSDSTASPPPVGKASEKPGHAASVDRAAAAANETRHRELRTEKQTRFSEDVKEPKRASSVPLNLGAAADKTKEELPQDPKAIHLRRMEALAKLMHIKSQGIELTRTYNMNSELGDMEAEIRYHTDLQNKKQSINLSKSFMVNAITALEFLNDRYDPFGFQLKGWSEQMRLNVDDYNDVFGELHEKYKHRGKKMEPEVKLVLMVAASAASFHASKAMLGSFPGMEQVISANPELMQRIQSGINKGISGVGVPGAAGGAGMGGAGMGGAVKPEQDAKKQQELYNEMMRTRNMQDQIMKQQSALEQQMNAHMQQVNQDIRKIEIETTLATGDKRPIPAAPVRPSAPASLPPNSGLPPTEASKRAAVATILNKIKQGGTRSATKPADDTETDSYSTLEVTSTIESESVQNRSNITNKRAGRKSKTVIKPT